MCFESEICVVDSVCVLTKLESKTKLTSALNAAFLTEFEAFFNFDFLLCLENLISSRF